MKSIFVIVFSLSILGVSTASVSAVTEIDATAAGIGTADPQSPLHIVTAGVSAVRMEETTGNKIWIFGNDFTNFNNGFTIWNPTAGFTILIDHTTGNVGFGTTSPQSPLHIKNAGVSAVRMEETTGNKIWIFGNDFTNFNNAFTIWNPSAGFALLMDHTTGNVGLGTTSPQERLDVNGNIRLNGNILSAGGDICIGTCP